ncbi:uncharacterized protein LOC130737152 [Lotus japonicus]|nr:uncharacterized protein LOC130737152 [Lotus japonicus]
MGSAEKRRSIKDVLKKVKFEVLLIQETKLGDSSSRTGERFAKSLNFKFAEVLAVGSAGGLLSCWDPAIINVSEVIKEQNYILLVAQVPSLQYKICIGNIYGPKSMSSRREVFTKLVEEIERLDICYCLGGDLNGTLNHGERRGMLDEVDPNLGDLVSSLNLIDLPLANADFTWFSSRFGGIWSRLDRWLLSEMIMRDLEGVNQSAESWGLSDHRAKSLSMGAVDFGPKPFKFYNSWMMEEDFNDLVKSWWNSPLLAEWAGANLHDKLKV